MKVHKLIALIEADGWVQVRMKGSHRQFRHPTMKATVTVSHRLWETERGHTAGNIE